MKDEAKHYDDQSKDALKANTAVFSKGVIQSLKGIFESTFEPIHLEFHPVRQT